MKSVPWLCTNSLFCAVAVASHKLNLEYRRRRPVSPLQIHPHMLSSMTHTQARLLSVQQWFEGSRLGSGWWCRPLLVSGRAGACVIRTRQPEGPPSTAAAVPPSLLPGVLAAVPPPLLPGALRATDIQLFVHVRSYMSNFSGRTFRHLPMALRNPRRSATPPVILPDPLGLLCSKTSCRFAGKATNARMVADTKRSPGCNSRVGSKPGGATSSSRCDW